MPFRKTISLAVCLFVLSVSGARAERDVVGLVTMDDNETLQIQMDVRRPGHAGIDHSFFELKKGEPGHEAMLLRVGGLKPNKQKLLFAEEVPGATQK